MIRMQRFRSKCRASGACRGLILVVAGSAVFVDAPAARAQRGARDRVTARGTHTEAHDARSAVNSYSSECEPDCPYFDIWGNVQEAAEDGGVASPAGTTYSVHHRLGSVPQGGGGVRCFVVAFPPPGGPDYVVRFDDIVEETTPYPQFLGGAVPEVAESASVTPDGRFLIHIRTDSLPDTDLFPGGLVDQEGQPLTYGCFTIGLDNLLDWPGMDNVVGGTLEFTIDGGTQIGPIDVTSSFSDPWDGFLNVVVPNASGLGINGARLQFLVSKSAVPPNDNCADAVEVFDGATAFSNVGATTDGPEEPDACGKANDFNVAADVWFEYNATCTGNLTIDLCDSFYDTKMAIYEGCNQCPPGADPLSCNDDFPLCGSLGEQSRLSAAAVEETCYTLRVGGFSGDQGPGTMRITCTPGACCNAGSCSDGVLEADCIEDQGQWFAGEECADFMCPPAPPSNDECPAAIPVLTGQPFQGTTDSATTSKHSFCVVGDEGDVWHKWTADCTGQATFSTCGSAFDTTLAIHDACDGNELTCQDERCPVPNNPGNSQATLMVEEGRTYLIRVAGFDVLEAGDYTLTVTGCRVGCCLATGFCAFADTEEICEANNGTPLSRTLPCRQRDLNLNGVDDACEFCPDAMIVDASPLDGTVDARQPHAAHVQRPAFGIGAPGATGVQREAIVLTLDPPVSGARHCFRLCETIEQPGGGANDINGIVDLGSGQYEIVLRRAITPGAVTALRYLTDGRRIAYTSHPANVDNSGFANVDDLTEFLDCCFHGACTPAWGLYSCDLDHSGQATAPDMLTAIDLLLGVQMFDVWEDTSKPVNTICR